MNPVFLKIGPIELHYYGLMYAIAFFVGISLGKKIAKERNFDVDLVENYGKEMNAKKPLLCEAVAM